MRNYTQKNKVLILSEEKFYKADRKLFKNIKEF